MTRAAMTLCPSAVNNAMLIYSMLSVWLASRAIARVGNFVSCHLLVSYLLSAAVFCLFRQRVYSIQPYFVPIPPGRDQPAAAAVRCAREGNFRGETVQYVSRYNMSMNGQTRRTAV
jgi:hypothetical protein